MRREAKWHEFPKAKMAVKVVGNTAYIRDANRREWVVTKVGGLWPRQTDSRKALALNMVKFVEGMAAKEENDERTY